MEKEILLFGGLLLDHYFSVDRWPQRGQDGYVVGQARFVGGCAANMAVSIHNLGGHPHVVSCVGSDRSGETIQRYWREHGLSQRFILETEGETGSCLVFSEPNGERTFLTRKGWNSLFRLTWQKRCFVRAGVGGGNGILSSGGGGAADPFLPGASPQKRDTHSL